MEGVGEVNAHYTGKQVDYNIFSQFKDIAPVLLLSFLMGLLVTVVMNFFDSLMLKLSIGIVVGILTYLGVSALFRMVEYRYLVDLIKERIK